MRLNSPRKVSVWPFCPGLPPAYPRTGVVFKPVIDRYLAIETVLFMRRDQRSGTIKDFIDDLHFRLQALKIKIN